MKRIFGSVGLANRALILIGLVVALTTACVVTAAYWALSNEFSARARNDIETNLRTLALVYATKYPETKIKLEGDKVVRAEAPSFPASSRITRSSTPRLPTPAATRPCSSGIRPPSSSSAVPPT